jgi:hypothetical protein
MFHISLPATIGDITNTYPARILRLYRRSSRIFDSQGILAAIIPALFSRFSWGNVLSYLFPDDDAAECNLWRSRSARVNDVAMREVSGTDKEI